jgi:hypothetical protein
MGTWLLLLIGKSLKKYSLKEGQRQYTRDAACREPEPLPGGPCGRLVLASGPLLNLPLRPIP